MNKATSPSPGAQPLPASVELLVPLSRGVRLSTLGSLFWLALRQLCRGKRLLILCALFTLPIVLAILARVYNPNDPRSNVAFDLVLNMVPHALVPLVALLFASGMIQDEVEEQTLTYLLVRPLPKWAIYLVKLLAALLVSVVLTAVFITLTYAVIYGGDAALGDQVLPVCLPRTLALLTLSLTAYCAVFGFLSLWVKRSLVIGVAYIALFEGVLASIDFAVRRVT